MARRRNKSTTKPSPETSAARIADASDAASSDAMAAETGLPSPRIRWLISILVVVHLLAIGLSMTAVVASSQTQAGLNELMHPYTMPTHFRTQGERLFFTSGDNDESPLRIQVQRTGRESNGRESNGGESKDVATSLAIESAWETIEPRGVSGLGSNDRYRRWLSTVMTLVNSESPSLVAELLLPMLREDNTIRAVRIVRLPSDLLLSLDDGPAVPYVAVAVRSGDSVSLVRINEARLSTYHIDGAKNQTSEEGDDE